MDVKARVVLMRKNRSVESARCSLIITLCRHKHADKLLQCQSLVTIIRIFFGDSRFRPEEPLPHAMMPGTISVHELRFSVTLPAAVCPTEMDQVVADVASGLM